LSAAHSEHLPRSLWWVLIGITLVWGFNWTAMKVAISEVAPFTFRTFCLKDPLERLDISLVTGHRPSAMGLNKAHSRWRETCL